MSYQEDRDRFLVRVCAEGLPIRLAQTVLAKARTLNRHAEAECSSEAVCNDRVPCPGVKRPELCICDDWPVGTHAVGNHSNVMRTARADARIERQLAELLKPFKMGLVSAGALGIVAVTVPSGAETYGGAGGLVVPV